MIEDGAGPQNTIGYRDPEWVADQLGIDKQTVYKYLQDGTLPGLQLGRKWLISEKALVAHLDDMQRRQTLARRAAGSNLPEGFTSRIQDDIHSIGISAEMEARARNHNYIGQEHFLLAIAKAPQSVAAKALGAMGVDGERIKASVELVVGPGDADAVSREEALRLTPRAQRALDLAGVAASQEGVSVGSKHLVSGILGESSGVGAAVLRALSVEPDRFAEAVAEVTGSDAVANAAETPSAMANPLTNAHSLTPREVEILKLIAEGSSNEQIAEELFISIRTVERHISNIYAKTGVSNRTEAADYAERNGLA